MTDTASYRPNTPLLAVDVVIRLADYTSPNVVLVERLHPPHGWALPGGFVEIGEPVGQAAVREAREETGLNVDLLELLGCYSEPDRDPRGHCVSIVFTATATGRPRGADDALRAAVFMLDALPETLVFDHAGILRDYATGVRGIWR